MAIQVHRGDDVELEPPTLARTQAAPPSDLLETLAAPAPLSLHQMTVAMRQAMALPWMSTE